MADQKISELTAKTTPVSADLLALVDTEVSPDETKKITYGDLLTAIKADSNIADAISKKHSQNTDTDLGATFEATFEKSANKGTVSGYASLNASTKVVEQPSSISDHLEGSPTEDLATKAPTSEWAFDHNAKAATALIQGHATAAQITKLDGIETGATKYPDTGEQAFLDADHTKLDGIEALADVTSTHDPKAHKASHAVSEADTVFPADPGDDRYLMWDDDPGQLAWGTPAGAGDVSAAANMTDNTLIKGDGGAKGVQDTGIVVDDSDNINMNGGTITNAGHGVADNQVVTVDAADVADNEYARFTANGLESRTAAEVAADLQGSITGLCPSAYKASSEIVNNSAVLQNDDDLHFAVEANKWYWFIAYIVFTSPTTPDIKWYWTVPTGGDYSCSFSGQIGSSSSSNDELSYIYNGSSAYVTNTTNNWRTMMMFGNVRNGANAGNFQLQWAQNTANASDTTVGLGSYVIYGKLN